MRQSTFMSTGLAVFTAVLAGACGGGQAPVYSLQPTDAPLRYTITAVGSQTVETPNGPAGGGFDTDAVVLLSLGEAASAGRAFSVKFESFNAILESQLGKNKVDGSSVVGPEFRGVVISGGAIRMTETPEVEAGVSGSRTASWQCSRIFWRRFLRAGAIRSRVGHTPTYCLRAVAWTDRRATRVRPDLRAIRRGTAFRLP